MLIRGNAPILNRETLPRSWGNTDGASSESVFRDGPALTLRKLVSLLRGTR